MSGDRASGPERLPPEGTADPRRVARVVNRLVDGRMAVVGEVALPEAGGEVAVDDPRVHEAACVLVMQPWWVTWTVAGKGAVTFTATAGAADRVLRYAVLG